MKHVLIIMNVIVSKANLQLGYDRNCFVINIWRGGKPWYQTQGKPTDFSGVVSCELKGIFSHASFVIGGQQVRFWRDILFRNNSLENEYPSLQNIVWHTNVSVPDV